MPEKNTSKPTEKPKKKRAKISKMGREAINYLQTDPAVKAVVTSTISAHAARTMSKKGLGYSIAGLIAGRLAARSVPGALFVGGTMVAKALYDRKKAKKDRESVSAASEKNAISETRKDDNGS